MFLVVAEVGGPIASDNLDCMTSNVLIIAYATICYRYRLQERRTSCEYGRDFIITRAILSTTTLVVNNIEAQRSVG